MNYRMVMWKPRESQLLTRRKDREGVDARQRSARFIGHVIAVLTFEKVITNVSNVREKNRAYVHSKKRKKGREKERRRKEKQDTIVSLTFSITFLLLCSSICNVPFNQGWEIIMSTVSITSKYRKKLLLI